MKHFSTVVLLCAVSVFSMAQAPQLFNYQAVARDLSGNPLPNKSIGIKISILRNSPNGTVSYAETHQPVTNQLGLFALQIGSGTAVLGNINNIDWGNASHFLQLEMDPNGGSAYQLVGTSQLVSVPYALYAARAKLNAGTGLIQTNDTLLARNTEPIWNAGWLQGSVVGNEQPKQGDFLMYDNGKWIPHKPTNAVVPSGTCINSTNPSPPMCYVYSGNYFTTAVTDPNGHWTEKAKMPTARTSSFAAVLNNKLYVMGGGIGPATYTDVVEVYDPVTNSWETKSPIASGARAGGTAGVANGKIYLIGGRNPSTTNLNEEYDPVSNTWTVRAPMPHGRYGLPSSTATAGGKIYVIGGYNDGFQWENYNEAYNPQTNSWETKAPMPTARANCTAIEMNGNVYVLGGGSSTTNFLNKFERYNPATDTWQALPAMITARTGHVCEVVGGKMYAIGGSAGGNNVFQDNEAFDFQTNTWEKKKPMPTARFYGASGMINGKIYVVGGTTLVNSADAITAVNEEFNPDAVLETTYYIHCAE